MSTDAEIKEKCFVHRRFIQSVMELQKHNCDFRFDNLLKEALGEIIKIAEQPEKSNILRSKTYADYFNEEIGITFEKGNPFCVCLFSKSLSINIVFVLLKECEECGYTPILTRGSEGLKDSHIVCAFDLFDLSRNESFFRIKKRCG